MNRPALRGPQPSEADTAPLPPPPPTLEDALGLVESGWAIFPLLPDGKTPLKHTRGHCDATTNPDQIIAWHGVCSELNWGIAVPDGLCVLDFDPRNGCEPTFREFVELGLPDTLTVETGGGGLHLWYKIPEGWALPGKPGQGVDCKQLGGFVVAPPSTHESGYTYQWVDTSVPIAEAPEWLVARGWVRYERAVVVIEEDERTLPDEVLDEVVQQIEPHYVQGVKHPMAKNLGGWLKQRGFSAADVAYVVSQLPSTNPAARVEGAVAAFGIVKEYGWHELKAMLGEESANALDACTPHPRHEAEQAILSRAEQLAESRNRNTPTIVVDNYEGPDFEEWDLTEEIPPLSYVVPGLELGGPGRPNMIVGYSNSGKTTITQALALAIAMGLLAFGRFPVRRTKVLHLDYEAGIVARENYVRLCRALNCPIESTRGHLFAGSAHVYLDAPDAEARLAALILAKGAGFVVVDTMRAAGGAFDENKAEIAIPLYMLERVSRACGCTIVILHHENKPDGVHTREAKHRISGHNAIHGALQVALSVEQSADGIVIVSPSKKIRTGFEPFALKFVDVHEPGTSDAKKIARAGEPSWGLKIEVVEIPAPGTVQGVAKQQEKIEALKPQLLGALKHRDPKKQGMRVAEIAHAIQARKEDATAALRELENAGSVKSRSAGQSKMYHLPRTQEEQWNLDRPGYPWPGPIQPVEN